MDKTIEKLYAYSKGIASEEEKKAMRAYLLSHPQKLEWVAKMMDDDYSGLIDEGNSFSKNGKSILRMNVNSFQNFGKKPSSQITDNSGFDKRLGDLLDELK